MGTDMAVRREPVWVETAPMSQGKAAAPRPETARMNPAVRGVGLRCMRRAKVEGKKGARLSPKRMLQRESEAAWWEVESAAMKTKERARPRRCMVISRM